MARGDPFLKVWLIVVSTLASLASPCALAQMPTVNGFSYAPDEVLLGNGQAWHRRTAVANTPRELIFRSPDDSELPVIQKAKTLFENSSAKAMALIDGNEVVWISHKPPASDKNRYMSFSVGKTVTSMAIGKALCANKLSLNDTVSKLLPDFEETDLAKATVRDLLTMSSGTWEGNPDSTVFSAEHEKQVIAGQVSYKELMRLPSIASAHKTFWGNKRQPGEEFTYRSTDPLMLGFIINAVTQMTYAEWVEKEVLLPAGIRRPAIIGQDKYGYGRADGSVRLFLDDWIRFAIWVKENSVADGCFGNYVREASRVQISNRAKRFGAGFYSYGYLMWVDHYRMRDSVIAVGYGGQRIGWNHKNNRMIIAFSNVENWMDDLVMLYREWSELKRK